MYTGHYNILSMYVCMILFWSYEKFTISVQNVYLHAYMVSITLSTCWWLNQ